MFKITIGAYQNPQTTRMTTKKAEVITLAVNYVKKTATRTYKRGGVVDKIMHRFVEINDPMRRA